MRNISTPVTDVLVVGRMPTISTSSPTLTMPRSTRPVTTVPRPEIENTSSIGIRNGLSIGRSGCGMDASTASISLRMASWPSRLVAVVERHQRRAADDRDRVAGELVLGEQLAYLELDQVEKLGIVDHVDLVEEHDQRRHADLTGEQDVLAGLRHRTVGGGDDQDGEILEEWNRIIETNVTGVFLCSRAGIPRMRRRGGGYIINISSLAERTPSRPRRRTTPPSSP